MPYALTYISPFTIYLVKDDYPSIEACERDCETRYNVKGLKFKESDGSWRAIVSSEEGAIVLRLVEIKTDDI